MKILAIETSCDETAIAILECSGSKTKPEISILANLVSSQVALHAPFGGVVPNLAKREHQKTLVPLCIAALTEAHMVHKRENKSADHDVFANIFGHEPELFRLFNESMLHLEAPEIDALAVTHGPGLAPALWVGINFARALSYLWKKPLIPMNHMEGHLFSPLLSGNQEVTFPALALLVSGGHTELVLLEAPGAYKVIGETQDDAAGEAFDKVARLLGLEYPGGPAIANQAVQSNTSSDVALPRPMLHSKDYNFSFSGLKTAVFYLVRNLSPDQKNQLTPEIAKEFQDAVVDVLVAKTIRAAREHNINTLLLGGGVAANKELQKRITQSQQNELPGTRLLLPDPAYTGDNALMIGLAAYINGKEKAWNSVQAEANLRLN